MPSGWSFIIDRLSRQISRRESPSLSVKNRSVIGPTPIVMLYTTNIPTIPTSSSQVCRNMPLAPERASKIKLKKPIDAPAIPALDREKSKASKSTTTPNASNACRFNLSEARIFFKVYPCPQPPCANVKPRARGHTISTKPAKWLRLIKVPRASPI